MRWWWNFDAEQALTSIEGWFDEHEHEHFQTFQEAVTESSDRAAIVLSAAMLDSELESLLYAAFRLLSRQSIKDSDCDKEVKKLLSFDPDNYVPLTGGAAKARLAFVLGLLDPSTFKAIKEIFSIRNLYAHEKNPPDSHERITSICTLIELDKEFTFQSKKLAKITGGKSFQANSFAYACYHICVYLKYQRKMFDFYKRPSQPDLENPIVRALLGLDQPESPSNEESRFESGDCT